MRRVSAAPSNLVDRDIVIEAAGTFHNLAAIAKRLLLCCFGVSRSFRLCTLALQFLALSSCGLQFFYYFVIDVTRWTQLVRRDGPAALSWPSELVVWSRCTSRVRFFCYVEGKISAIEMAKLL